MKKLKLIGLPELVKRHAKKYGVTQDEARTQLTNAFSVLEDALLDQDYDGVQLKDFITLQVKSREYTQNRNPKDPSQVYPPVVRKTIKCTRGKAFNQRLNA